jgi:hypothetical protein
MTKIVSAFTIIVVSLGVLLHADAAGAQSPRTWVSGTGSGSACTRATPCATFAAAYAATSAGGEIDVLNGGDYGGLTIDHAITIANDDAGASAITPTGSNSIRIQAGSTDAITLRGLNLNGVNSQASGAVGFISGGSLLIDHCKIQGFQTLAGVIFSPINAAKLWVADTVLSNDGASNGASVWIASFSGAAVTAHLERVQALQAIGNGIRVDGTTTGGGAIDIGLHDVTVDAASSSGIVAVSATSGGPAVKIMADDVTSSHNNGFGLRAVGGTASIFLRRSTVTGNTVGIAASSGGVMATYGDNGVTDNVNGDGAATTTIPPK